MIKSRTKRIFKKSNFCFWTKRSELKKECSNLRNLEGYRSQNGENLITRISVEGYDLAFWQKGSTIIDCTDIKTKSRELSRLLGVEILPVHLSSLREGD